MLGPCSTFALFSGGEALDRLVHPLMLFAHVDVNSTRFPNCFLAESSAPLSESRAAERRNDSKRSNTLRTQSLRNTQSVSACFAPADTEARLLESRSIICPSAAHRPVCAMDASMEASMTMASARGWPEGWRDMTREQKLGYIMLKLESLERRALFSANANDNDEESDAEAYQQILHIDRTTCSSPSALATVSGGRGFR